MRPVGWLASLLAPLRRFFEARSDGAQQPPAPEVDLAEELQKLHRGLRRLSLASDRSSEMLQAVSARLDDIQQRFLQMSRPARVGITLEEATVLRVLDQLDFVSSAMEPGAALERIGSARSTLLQAAGWQPLAVPGARPEGIDIRIAERIGEPAGNGHDEVRIVRVLEQGYRRADGSLLRPGVVIAGSSNHTLS